MSGISTHYNNRILESLFKGHMFTTPEKWVALFYEDTGLMENDKDSWTELPSYVDPDEESNPTGYVRIKIENDMWKDPENSQTANKENVSFPIAERDWGLIKCVALMDAETDGTVIAFGYLRNTGTGEVQPREVLLSDQLIVRADALLLSMIETPYTM